MSETLVERVKRTKAITTIGPFVARATEARIVKNLKEYREEAMIYGNEKPFTREERKRACAPPIYAGIMTLARSGRTNTALQYAALFDREFKLSDATTTRFYR